MYSDIMPFVGMAFSLAVVLIIAGVILLAPLSKRLGTLIDLRLQERRSEGVAEVDAAEIERLGRVVGSLETEVAALAERQQFIERLLESGERTTASTGVGS